MQSNTECGSRGWWSLECCHWELWVSISYFLLDFVEAWTCLTVCSCHVTYAFQSESSLYSCLNVKELLDIQATIECGFTLKRIRDMTRTYSQMHRTDKYSEHSSVIWPVWPNGWVFVYELSGSEYESSCSHWTCLLCFQHYSYHKICCTTLTYHFS